MTSPYLDDLPPRLQAIGYVPPAEPADCVLDVVTPTCNRPQALLRQASLLGPQFGPLDRWIVVDDASQFETPLPIAGLAQSLPDLRQLLCVSLSYAKGDLPYGSTLQRARHAACSLARPHAWIVEVDDHDFVTPGCLAMIRETICRGALFIYGDCVHTTNDGSVLATYQKPDYERWLLRDRECPAEGVRCYPKFLYEAVGGFRWHGDREPGGNEWPAGDYGLFLRIEQFCDGYGFVRIPHVLCSTVKTAEGISVKYANEQSGMAAQLRAAAQMGVL